MISVCRQCGNNILQQYFPIWKSQFVKNHIGIELFLVPTNFQRIKLTLNYFSFVQIFKAMPSKSWTCTSYQAVLRFFQIFFGGYFDSLLFVFLFLNFFLQISFNYSMDIFLNILWRYFVFFITCFCISFCLLLVLHIFCLPWSEIWQGWIWIVYSLYRK